MHRERGGGTRGARVSARSGAARTRHHLRTAEKNGLRYLPAYDDIDVVAGQGTVGLEIAEQAPDCDTVAVAVGVAG